jgi:hypothetical protein
MRAMNMVVHNIPINLVHAYRGREVIVRTHDPAALVKALPESDLGNVVGVQLLSLLADVDVLADWGYAIPVELAMRDPVTEFALLYRHAKLLDFYLHQASISQPVEFFHTTLVSLFDRNPMTLWAVQGEDPAYIRYVTADGEERVARRMAGAAEPGELESFVPNLRDELLAEHSECSRCEFFDYCGGYFKWPRKDYSCDGVKLVLQGLKDAAIELEHDLELFKEARREAVR